MRAPGDAPSTGALRRQLAYALPFGAAMALNVPQQLSHQYAVALVVPPAMFAIYGLLTRYVARDGIWTVGPA